MELSRRIAVIRHCILKGVRGTVETPRGLKDHAVGDPLCRYAEKKEKHRWGWV